MSATRSPGLSAAIPAPQEQPRPAGQAGDSWRKGPVGEGSQWGPETSLPAAARGAETRAAQRAGQKCSCAQGWGKEHVSLQPSCCAVSSHPQCPGTGSAWPCLHAQPAHGSLCSLTVAGATASTHPCACPCALPRQHQRRAQRESQPHILHRRGQTSHPQPPNPLLLTGAQPRPRGAVATPAWLSTMGLQVSTSPGPAV